MVAGIVCTDIPNVAWIFGGRKKEAPLAKGQLHTPVKPMPIAEDEEAVVSNFDLAPALSLDMGDVQLNGMSMEYQEFAPRLYLWAKSLGMEKGLIVPYTSFSPDGNHGYGVVQILKNFGAFPVNQGYLGGIMALDWHDQYSTHGQDAVIIHAPHVGYDPKTNRFGNFCDVGDKVTRGCGTIADTIAPYIQEYEEMHKKVWIGFHGDDMQVVISNDALREDDGNTEGMFLRLDKIVADGVDRPILRQSFSRVYRASTWFTEQARSVLGNADGTMTAVRLPPGFLDESMCYFKKPSLANTQETHLHRLLLPQMPKILSGSLDPELTAALVIMQSEFDRTVRFLSTSPAYNGKRLLFVSGLNVDVHPDDEEQQAFFSTSFVPWAAYIRDPVHGAYVLEQMELYDELQNRPIENPDAIDLEVSMAESTRRQRERVEFYAKS